MFQHFPAAEDEKVSHGRGLSACPSGQSCDSNGEGQRPSASRSIRHQDTPRLSKETVPTGPIGHLPETGRTCWSF